MVHEADARLVLPAAVMFGGDKGAAAFLPAPPYLLQTRRTISERDQTFFADLARLAVLAPQ